MRSRKDCRKRVSNKDGDDTARKVEVIERGTANFKILALPHNRSEKTMTLKSDQKHEAAIVLAAEKVDETAVTCDETFDLSYEEVIEKEGPTLICKGNTPDTEFYGEGLASENFLNLSMESIFTFSDEEESHDSGIVFLEDEEESISPTRVSTFVYPKRDAKENDNVETTFATIGMKDAPNPMDAAENIENFTRTISNFQAAFADSFKNLSGRVRDVNALCVDAEFQSELMGSFAYKCTDIVHDDDATENSFDFTESYDGSSTWNSSVNYDRYFTCHSNVADFPFDEISVGSTHSSEGSASLAENNENGRVSDDNLNADNNAIVNGDDNVRDKDNLNDNLNDKVLTKDDNASLNDLGNDLGKGILKVKDDNAIRNGECSVSDYGDFNEKVSDIDVDQLLQDLAHFDKVLTKDDNASLNDLGKGILKVKDDNAIRNGECSVSDYGDFNEKVSDIDVDQLLQDLAHFEQLNFDLRKSKAVSSKRKFGLLKRPKERENKVNHKNRTKLSEEKDDKKDDNAVRNGECSVIDYGGLNEKVPDTDVQDLAHFDQLNFDLRKSKAVRSKRKFGLLKHLKERKNKANHKNREKLSEERSSVVAPAFSLAWSFLSRRFYATGRMHPRSI